MVQSVIDHIVSTGVSHTLQTTDLVPLLPPWLQPGRLLARAGVTAANCPQFCTEISECLYVLAQSLSVLTHHSSLGELIGGLRRVTVVPGPKATLQLSRLRRNQAYLTSLGTVSVLTEQQYP